MPDVCFYFQVHQPNRLAARPGSGLALEDHELNQRILNRVAERCYLPCNQLFAQLIDEHRGRFRFAMSLTGTFIEQLRCFRPDVLASFQQLVATGGVELLAETYHHSLCFTHSNREFDRQIDLHLEMLEETFAVRPRVFRNTELIYNNAIAAKAETLGFDGVLAEGITAFLAQTSPNFLYRAPGTSRIKTLLRHYEFSDDLAFRFAHGGSGGGPLEARAFASKLAAQEGDVVNLFLDYEAIGEHQPAATGIFEFWQQLPQALIDAGLQHVTPSEAISLYRASREYDCFRISSWADTERDLSAWLGNPMQQDAFRRIRLLEPYVMQSGDRRLLDCWARLQTSDHFYWMCDKSGPDGEVHRYFNPYASPADAHRIYSNAVTALEHAMTPPSLVA